MLKVPISHARAHTHTQRGREETFRGDGYVCGVFMVMVSWVYTSNSSGCIR